MIAEREFGKKSITGLFWKYSLFALAGLAIQGVAAIADGFFVGNGVGAIGLETVSVILPLATATIAIYLLFGIGSSTIAAIKLGNGDVEGAREVYGSVIVFALFFSVAIAVIVLLNMDAILTCFGANADVLPTARTWGITFMLGFPLYIVGNIAYSFTRLAERPFAASLSIIGGSVVGMVSEYFIIYVLKLGMAGSAFSYVVAIGATVFLVPYLQLSSTPFKIKASDFKINFKIIKETFQTGSAIFFAQIATIVSTVIINNLILVYGIPKLDLAAFGIINAYIAYVLTLLTTAFVTGIQPIASYNLGAKLYLRVSTLVKVGIAQSTAVIIAIMVIVFTFASPIISFFAGPDPALVTATKAAMKIYLLLYALGNVSQIISGYYMAVEKNGLAILNGLARVIIFAVPLLLILPHYFGLEGVWMAQPGADTLSFILALVCIWGESKSLKKMDSAKLQEPSLSVAVRKVI